jgi:predicted Zn-dependent protease
MSSHPKNWLFQLLCCLLLLAGGVPVCAQNTANDDELLQVLQKSVKENFAQLQENHYPPYYMAYRVDEVSSYQLHADFGHIYENSSTRNAVLAIEIRVGTPETDNYHYLFQQNNRLVKQIPITLDQNPNSIEEMLARETEYAYEDAKLQYFENRNNCFLFQQEENRSYHYALGDYVHYYEPPMMDNYWDADFWAQQLRHCTAEVAVFPALTEASANLYYQINRKYLVDSEKKAIAENSSSATLRLKIEGITSEDEVEHIERQYFARQLELLPDAEVLLQEMRDMETKLSDVLHASNEEMYNGNFNAPVLLSENAASVLAHHLFGHTLEGTRACVGLSMENTIPSEFSIISDPTLMEYGGYSLSGSYHFDDEGIEGQRVVIFDRGEYHHNISTRTYDPTDSHSHPNGHARGSRYLPSPRQSNLLVTTKKPYRFEQMVEFLLAEAEKQNLDYGLYVEEAEIRCDTSKNMIYLYPTVCYQFFTRVHPDEIVRDIVIGGTPQQWFSNLMAGGEKPGSVSILCHNHHDDVVTHSCAPALLFRQAEVAHRIPATKKRIINHLAASFSEKTGKASELFFQTAQEVWDKDGKKLSVGEENNPYYQDYMMTDAKIFAVEASGGNVCYSHEQEVRKLVPKVLLGSDAINNGNIFTGEPSLPTGYPIAVDDADQAFARDFRKATESEYLKAVKQWEQKKYLMEEYGSQKMNDNSKISVYQVYDAEVSSHHIINDLEAFASNASSMLSKYDFLSRSGINVYALSGNVDYWSSENSAYIRPVTIIGVQIYGAVMRPGRREIADTKTIFLSSADSLVISQQIKNEIDAMISHLKKVKESSVAVVDGYDGPVLVEGEAVGQLLVSALLEGTPNLLAQRKPYFTSLEAKNQFKYNNLEDCLDRVVTHKGISVTANKSDKIYDNLTFCRVFKTDAEGAETGEMDLIQKGELVALMSNRIPTKASPFSNGFQQLGIHHGSCVPMLGAARLDFDFRTTVPKQKLKGQLLKEARKQGCRYAYIIRQLDNDGQDVDKETNTKNILQLYRVNVQTGKEEVVANGGSVTISFDILNRLLCVSQEKSAFPIMVRVAGAKGTRDFPFAGVPTCIVAPDGMLLYRVFVAQ